MSLMAPTRILIVGGGGREHALAWKLAAEPGVNEIVVAPGSDAIGLEPRVRCVPGVDPLDGAAVVAVARREAAELVVIGPEAPLAAGVADALLEAGFAVFGPTAAAARIESSKAYCHDVAAAAGVRMARAEAFTDASAAIAFASGLAASGRGVVVKADGLAAGKGVTMCDSAADAERAIGELAAGVGPDPGAPWVVVEERLVGSEASLIALCDGRDAVALPLARDHKRLRDGDDWAEHRWDGCLQPVARPRGRPRRRPPRGVPSAHPRRAGGSRDAVPRCPVRRPDAHRRWPRPARVQRALRGPRDAGDHAKTGGIARADPPRRGPRSSRWTASPGPPWPAAGCRSCRARRSPSCWRRQATRTTRDRAIRSTASTTAVARGALVFHAGTRRDADGRYRTAGGRVLTVVGRGADLDAAREAADLAADRIHIAGSQRRHDIGRLATSGALAR